MAFAKSQVSPPCVVEPGSCQAVRICGIIGDPLARVEVTPEWLAENEAKQKAYEQRRAEWLKHAGIADENTK